MKKTSSALALIACAIFAITCFAQSNDSVESEVAAPLRLVQAIPLPNVAGRIDHFTLDTKRKWVIGSALGNNTVEIVDAFAGRVVKTIPGLDEPQGVLFVGDPVNKLFVANAGDGKLRIYEGKTFGLIDTLDFGENTDNLRYVPTEKRVYVGYGEDEKSAIGVVDAVTNKRLDDAGKLDSHPESFQIELSGSRIFVNIASKQKIAIIDRKTHQVTDWEIGNLKANFPMALDEADHRIFIGTRKPSRLGVIDTTSGKLVTSLPAAGDMDDLYYDDSRKRIYIPGGEGFISVYEQSDPDHYKVLAKIQGAVGARTGVWYAKRDRLYVAVPGRANQGAEIWVYEAQD
jgi:DNA-binding beta-propeller fold protein YncE